MSNKWAFSQESSVQKQQTPKAHLEPKHFQPVSLQWDVHKTQKTSRLLTYIKHGEAYIKNDDWILTPALKAGNWRGYTFLCIFKMILISIYYPKENKEQVWADPIFLGIVVIMYFIKVCVHMYFFKKKLCRTKDFFKCISLNQASKTIQGTQWFG